jgi:hypothetical protein
MAKVRAELDAGDRGESDPRVAEFAFNHFRHFDAELIRQALASVAVGLHRRDPAIE